jgi:hypothetical protein
MTTTHSNQRRRRWSLLLLLIPFIVLLWPPFYNSWDPQIFGIPFFYWFQLLWVIITSIITATVYFIEGRVDTIVTPVPPERTA